MKTDGERRWPIGSEVGSGGVNFRVWAPNRRRVEVIFENGGTPPATLSPDGDGYHRGFVRGVGAGARYRYRLDADGPFPDPAARFQPDGPPGSSEVIDPGSFAWSDAGWCGLDVDRQVIYELHVGTFTAEGTWEAAADKLPVLADLGITTIELMPVADFPGRFGWGYDGVNFFAPTRLYGRPDGMRRFVDEAHRNGMAVILDVVYNHFGPDQNFLPDFSPHYLSKRHTSDWGDSFNFDDEGNESVREFVLTNVGAWIEEYHLDGLRVDATQAIHDDSPEHILMHIVRRVREVAGERRTLVVAENETQDVRLLLPADRGGFGFDMVWSDDFHHTSSVALTGRNDAYYADYAGSAQEFVSALKRGFLYQGQQNVRQGKRRGTTCFDLAPSRFVFFLQNHDQVANSMRGERLHHLSGPGRFRAVTALWLLAPQTPMFFQGQEFASSSPFLYFMDHEPELAKAVTRGHADFLKQFEDLALPEIQARLADPSDPATFERCKLDHSEPEHNATIHALHRDLLRLRRTEQALRGPVDGAVLGPETFLVRYFDRDGDDRLLVVNLGPARHLDPVSEPLMAPPTGSGWGILWSSEAPEYGGTGMPPPEAADGWHLRGHAAVLLAPRTDALATSTE